MTIILYANRNTGVLVLAHLVALGHHVKVITEDPLMEEMAGRYWFDEYTRVPVVTLETMGKFDLFICCHGRKIIDAKYIVPGKFVNIHPCLFKYKGHNPIKRYIANGDTRGSVESHIMTEAVDEGEVINSQFFDTPVVSSYAEFYNIAYPYYIRCVDETLKRW